MTTPVLDLQPARRIQTAFIEKNGTGIRFCGSGFSRDSESGGYEGIAAEAAPTIEKNGTGIEFCRRRVSGAREQAAWSEKAVAAYAPPLIGTRRSGVSRDSESGGYEGIAAYAAPTGEYGGFA